MSPNLNQKKIGAYMIFIHKRKLDKPRDSLVTISSPGGIDKAINKKKRNT